MSFIAEGGAVIPCIPFRETRSILDQSRERLQAAAGAPHSGCHELAEVRADIAGLCQTVGDRVSERIGSSTNLEANSPALTRAEFELGCARSIVDRADPAADNVSSEANSMFRAVDHLAAAWIALVNFS
ncbi:MAG: hypothetical protein F4X83_00125 [Chloroflexi bacterium]|nr:hypothetical protein [Chloroflexota bacterium]